MVSREIPRMFYLDGMLYEKISIVRSDESVIAFCFQEEQRQSLHRGYVRKNFKKAYTIPAAARLMRVNPDRIKEIYNKGKLPPPEFSYDRKTFQKLRNYINEDDMLELRQVAWDLLLKNKYGEPFNDTMASATELEHLMKLGDDREFTIRDGQVIKVFRDD